MEEGGLRSFYTNKVISKKEVKAKTQINQSEESKLNLNQNSSEDLRLNLKYLKIKPTSTSIYI